MSQIDFKDALPDPHAVARRSDPWTSHAAAQSIPSEKLRASQKAVFDCFELHGSMHHDRLLELYQRDAFRYGWPRQSASGLRTRTHELVALRRLRKSDQVVTLESGRKSIVWEIV
jgi:hypothetical protein